MGTNQKEFLEELTALTHKYGIQIGGCGCCGSPAIYKVEPISREDATKIYTVDSEGENLTFDIPPVTSMFTRTKLSSPITVMPDEELVVTTDSTGAVTNVIKRKNDAIPARSVQEVFDVCIAVGNYDKHNNKDMMCLSLEQSVRENLITGEERDRCIKEIDAYVNPLTYSTLKRLLTAHKRDSSFKARLQIYTDWANKPNIREPI